MIKYEFELPGRISLNQYYSGMHWTKRARITKEWEEFIYFLAKEQNAKFITNYPISVAYEFHLKKQPPDCSNCVGMIKLIEDALKGVVWADDDPKHINKLSIIIAAPIPKGTKEKVIISIKPSKH